MLIDWKDVDVTSSTYWAVHNWNPSGEASGYAGFQEQSDKRTVHFALWDPIASNEAIETEYLDENTVTSNFDGEGTGRNASAKYNWQEGQWLYVLGKKIIIPSTVNGSKMKKAIGYKQLF